MYFKKKNILLTAAPTIQILNLLKELSTHLDRAEQNLREIL